MTQINKFQETKLVVITRSDIHPGYQVVLFYNRRWIYRNMKNEIFITKALENMAINTIIVQLIIKTAKLKLI